MLNLIKYIKNKFTSNKVSVSPGQALRRTLNLKPSGDDILERQQELMTLLYYGPLRKLSRHTSDNTYSFSYKENTSRMKFTARGAYLFRSEINEADLLNLRSYFNGNNIVTSSLTSAYKDKDRRAIRDSIHEIINLETSLDLDLDYLTMASRKQVSDFSRLNTLWRIYLDNQSLLTLYLYDIQDTTFVSEKFFRALFKAIAIEELYGNITANAYDRQVAYFEEIFKAAQACLFPLSLNGYTSLRNSLPKNVSDRMSTVKFKLKMIKNLRYESPYHMNNAKVNL